jgi:DNA polymerase III sliding clamp (beta) subunit (PCNA family)
MKFVLKQEKLEDMLEKLMVKDILPKSVLVAKGKTIQSVQKEEHARAFRLLKLNENYFESIDEVEDEEAIEFDVKKMSSLIKNIPANMNITWETKGNKIELSAEHRKFGVAIVEPEEIEKKLPFELKDGAPTWDETSLDTKVVIKTSDFKEISGYANSLATEFFNFKLDGKKLSIHVGDIHDFTEYAILDITDVDIKKGKELDVAFTYAIPQIADTFREEATIWAKTDMPAWFYEKTDEYFLGVLVPPYTEEE